MTGSQAPSNAPSRLERLSQYLERDPQNLMLIADAASAALDEAKPVEAVQLLERYAALAPLPPALVNLQGLAAMGERRYGDAAAAFESLFEIAGDDPTLRFNLAWSKTMLEDYPAVAALIDDAVVAAEPQAAVLKIEALHHQGLLEDALACGMGFAERNPDDAALMGALAVVALDAEDAQLAHAYAVRAGGANDDALAVLGAVAMAEQNFDEALGRFDQALALEPRNGRALLGRGLVLLAKGDAAAAVDALDAGAKTFASDPGTWVSLGWANFVAGDYPSARAAFEKAVALDATFADGHGSLAILDVMEGDFASAQTHMDAALSSDPVCVSAGLAKSLLLTAGGDQQAAEKVRETVLNTRFGPGGVTIAQAMAGLGALKPKA